MVALVQRPMLLRGAELLRRYAPVALTLALLVSLAAFLGHTYLGDSTSPYGTCYAANGRSVSCDALER